MEFVDFIWVVKVDGVNLESGWVGSYYDKVARIVVVQLEVVLDRGTFARGVPARRPVTVQHCHDVRW